MRRKAQAFVLQPANSEMAGDNILQELVSLLNAGVPAAQPAANALNPHKDLPADADLADVAAAEAAGAAALAPVDPEDAAGEAMEANAFDKLQCGLDCLEQGLAIFKEYEAMETEDHSGEGAKAEEAALKKIDKLVEDMKKVFEELKEAEIKEHEEKAEKAADGSGKEGTGTAKASAESEEEESSEDDKDTKESAKASVKGFTRTAAARTGLVPTDLQF